MEIQETSHEKECFYFLVEVKYFFLGQALNVASNHFQERLSVFVI